MCKETENSQWGVHVKSTGQLRVNTREGSILASNMSVMEGFCLRAVAGMLQNAASN